MIQLQNINKRYYELLLWILIWFTIFFLIDETGSERVKIATIITILFALPSYLHFYVFDHFFKNRKYLIYAVLVMVIVVGLALFEGYVLEDHGMQTSSWLNRITNNLIIIAVSMGIRYARKGILRQYNLQELRAKSLEYELNMLRTQLHPHFLYNTLNNIYALSLENSENTSDMILKLSEIMRYFTEKSKEKYVNFSEEEDFLRSYLDLEMLRLNDKTRIIFSTEKEMKNVKVNPTIFLPFIENAIKHGSSNIHESEINIHFKLRDRKLVLNVENDIVPNKSKISTLTGIHNVKRRLELLYKDKYELKIAEKDKKYSVKLELEV